MSVNSKSKGSRFERTISKWFTTWTGYEFNRVPASGGLRWKNADNITSDVTCTDSKHSKKFKFSIECKNYKDLKFEHILLEKKSCKILKFWDQALNDANRAKKLPMLIMKYNGMAKGEAFVMVDYEVYHLCIQPFAKLLTKANLGFHLNPQVKINEPGNVFYILLLSDLKNIPYKDFYESSKVAYERRYPKNKNTK